MFGLIRKLFKKTREVGSYVGTFRTHDAAFTFRMPTGFAGMVNRTHPANIEPCLIDPNTTIPYYGWPVLVDATTQGVRPLVAGDSGVTAIYGITVRPYPAQPSSGTNYGAIAAGAAGVPSPNQTIDVLKSGYIMVTLQNAAVNNSVKNGAVYIWYATNAGNHVQGGFEAANTPGSTLQLGAGAQNSTYFNGPAGSDGIVELAFNL